MKIRGVLNRLHHNEKQTLGHLIIYNGVDVVFECKTLELPDRFNVIGISRILPGIYKVAKRHSKKHGSHFHIGNVEDRSFILIHAGNLYTQIRGCVLVGKSFKDINKDGFRDVISSRATLNKLLIKTSEFELTINNIKE